MKTARRLLIDEVSVHVTVFEASARAYEAAAPTGAKGVVQSQGGIQVDRIHVRAGRCADLVVSHGQVNDHVRPDATQNLFDGPVVT